MPTVFAPRIDYNAITLLLTHPAEPHTISAQLVGGGRDVTASGIPVSYYVRVDQLGRLRIRCRDDEIAGVWAWLLWAMGPARTFTFWFDQTDAATSMVVYLEHPMAGERVEFTRVGDNLEWWEIEVELRRSGSVAPIDVRLVQV